MDHKLLLSVWDYNLDTGIFTKKKTGKILGTLHHTGYTQLSFQKKLYNSHRVAWFYVNGYWPNIIDPIDGVKSHNWIANLRNTTHSVNRMNQKITNSKSGIIGVQAHPLSPKFVARIKINGNGHYLGMFDTPQLASEAYQKAKKIYHKNNEIGGV